MYSLYDLYTDIMAGRTNEFSYDKEPFSVLFKGSVLIVVYRCEGKYIRAHLMKGKVTCMMDLQGPAACLRAEKKDLWFDRHGNFCSKEEFSGVTTQKQQQEDDLERIINSVLDINTSDRDIF